MYDEAFNDDVDREARSLLKRWLGISAALPLPNASGERMTAAEQAALARDAYDRAVVIVRIRHDEADRQNERKRERAFIASQRGGGR